MAEPTTVCIQIGNSDDKLSQAQWASFVKDVSDLLHTTKVKLHFSGASSSVARWQNACWVFEITGQTDLRLALHRIGRTYRQDSIAWLEGYTQFV